MQQTNRSRHRHITSFQVISLGFLSVILLGSLPLKNLVETLDMKIEESIAVGDSYNDLPM